MRFTYFQIASFIVGVVAPVTLAGCSGLLPSMAPAGYVVKPAYLGNFTNGRSMSTLWYRGSDHRYHYFKHSYKVCTNYRVKRSELMINPGDEFTYGSKQSVFAGPMVARCLKKQDVAADGNHSCVP